MNIVHVKYAIGANKEKLFCYFGAKNQLVFTKSKNKAFVFDYKLIAEQAIKTIQNRTGEVLRVFVLKY